MLLVSRNNRHLYYIIVSVFVRVLVLFVFYLYVINVTNLALWLQYLNKLTYLLTYLSHTVALYRRVT